MSICTLTIIIHLFNSGLRILDHIRILIIYRPGARGIRRNISRSDDISRGL